MTPSLTSTQDLFQSSMDTIYVEASQPSENVGSIDPPEDGMVAQAIAFARQLPEHHAVLLAERIAESSTALKEEAEAKAAHDHGNFQESQRQLSEEAARLTEKISFEVPIEASREEVCPKYSPEKTRSSTQQKLLLSSCLFTFSSERPSVEQT